MKETAQRGPRHAESPSQEMPTAVRGRKHSSGCLGKWGGVRRSGWVCPPSRLWWFYGPMSKVIKLCALNMCHLLYASDGSLELLKPQRCTLKRSGVKRVPACALNSPVEKGSGDAGPTGNRSRSWCWCAHSGGRQWVSPLSVPSG